MLLPHFNKQVLLGGFFLFVCFVVIVVVFV